MKPRTANTTRSRLWFRCALSLLALAVMIPPFLASGCPAPESSQPLQARLELAAGEVTVEQAGKSAPAFSGEALLPASRVSTGKGSRALVRLSNGSAVFMRGGSVVVLGDEVTLESGEVWLDAPPTERDAVVHKLGEVSVFAVDAGLSIQRTADGAVIYVARGAATVTAPGGRVEVQGGEQATVAGQGAPAVLPVAFWEDWTGGMADRRLLGGLAGAGSGQIYGVALGSAGQAPARTLEISRQSVRAVIRSGLAETEVDQTFFNPTDQPLEGWYWFTVPQDASVTGFAVETDGVLVEGEFIERRQAAEEYARAAASGHAPALLEWINNRTCRARIFPVPAAGSRRVVVRYLQLLPVNDGTIRYLYPLQTTEPVRIGEFSLSVDLGDDGPGAAITTLADARVEPGGRLVTMRRSGYTPRADFMLEARLDEPAEPLRLARQSAGADTADYVMLRYAPDFDWLAGKELRGEVVVVVDTSADSDPAARSMKATTTEAILRALSDQDRFALVSLDVRPTVLHPAEGLAPASEAEIGQALERLAGHASGGATDLAALFDVALTRLHGGEQPAVIYVGDGIATSGEMRGAKLAEKLERALSTSRARLFTVGVGPHANQALLATLARAGGGEAFHIEGPARITERALRLVAALKTPTMTEFAIDLGAGMDEVFVSANGKVKHGEEVIVLARTHHRIPARITVKGRLAGEQVTREYPVTPETGALNAFVARLWAAEYLRRMVGSSGDLASQRGKIMQMGIDYGLMTPYTSLLALESEHAYQQQGIPRRHSPLRGVRLSQVTPASAGTDVFQVTTDSVGFGCSKESSDYASAGSSQEVTGPVRPAVAPGQPGPAMTAKRPPRRKKRSVRAAETKAIRAPAEAEAPMKEGVSADLGASAPATRDGDDRARRPKNRIEPYTQACSDASRRSLRERVILWRKGFRTARTPQELIGRYRAAFASCELPDWRSEAAFFRVMQPAIQSEGAATSILSAFSHQPATQRYLARLILRRAVDPRIIAAVERVLFGDKVNWDKVDAELAAVVDTDKRIALLRGLMVRVPDDPNGIMRMVHLLVENDLLDEALVQGRRLRDAGLITPYLARELGDVLARKERDAEAVRTYSEIVEFDPGSLPSRRLLGDIYLAHGWYDPAYRQYKTLTEAAPNEPLYWLRLAAASAGTGRVDQALRLERKIASAPGRPGPDDPRRWARLWSTARLARLMHQPPAGVSAKTIASKLKELQLFRGNGTLVILTWEDLSANVLLATLRDGVESAAGESTDAARTGLSAVLLSPGDLSRFQLRAYLRSTPTRHAVKLRRQDVTWDGNRFQVEVTEHVLAAGKTRVDL